jgi:hypothetical protein
LVVIHSPPEMLPIQLEWSGSAVGQCIVLTKGIEWKHAAMCKSAAWIVHRDTRGVMTLVQEMNFAVQIPFDSDTHCIRTLESRTTTLNTATVVSFGGRTLAANENVLVTY